MIRTFQPSKTKRRRTHGFMKRMRDSSKVIKDRRRKGRKRLTFSTNY
jgi:large subunit ribosomal protein L34